MYRISSIFDQDIYLISKDERVLRVFLFEHDAALGHAAFILAGRSGVQLVNEIRSGLDQPGPLTRRLRSLLLNLHGLLSLEHTDSWEESDLSIEIEPDDPMVHEICLLANQLDDALRVADVAH
tara:strand:+ start:6697 stop:7065 length:369 start_codon:yes stop_codon:yes gene_type:complete